MHSDALVEYGNDIIAEMSYNIIFNPQKEERVFMLKEIDWLLGWSTFTFLGFWALHLFLTRRDSSAWNFANFGTFMREFRKRQWERQDNYPSSFFSFSLDSNGYKKQDGSVHSGIIKFNDLGMVLYPWSYVRFIFWSLANRQKKCKRDKNLWKQSELRRNG